MFIHHFLEHSALSHPDKVALIHEQVRATYSEINSTANSLAAFLISKGISIEDRVAIIFENCFEYVVSYYGVLKTGAAVTPLSTDLKPDSLAYLLHDLKPDMIIASKRFERLLKATAPDVIQQTALIIQNPKPDWSSNRTDVFSWEDAIKNNPGKNLDLKIEPKSLACIIYTSGSTGIPKGVMLSHNNIVSNTSSICRYLKLTEDDIQMVVLPFFYVMGKSLLNTHFAVSGTVVINNKFAFPAAVINQMIEEKVTGFSGVPSTYAYLLHRSPLEKHRKGLTSLRYCSQAGGHMSEQIKKDLRRVLPEHTQIYIMYGATEASARLSYLDPQVFEKKIGSIGKAIPDVQLKILDKNGEEVTPGETGELVSSGPNIMQGYLNDPELTQKVLDKNGYHTGDMAYQDEDGFYYLKGRKDNLLKVGGHRINPQEVEDAIMATGLVVETAVIGIPDELLGNKLTALIVKKDENITENQIMSSCADKLPKYKLPGSIKFIRALPKSTSGKIDRTKCLEKAL